MTPKIVYLSCDWAVGTSGWSSAGASCLGISFVVAGGMCYVERPSKRASFFAGHNGVVVPEESRALQQCADMLGGCMTPGLVDLMLRQCAKHAQHSNAWAVCKHAVDALGALAAALQASCLAQLSISLEL